MTLCVLLCGFGRGAPELWLDTEIAPLECTAGHPLYSEESTAWVPAGRLLAGEHVRARNGTAQVIGITYCEGTRQVYNVEVESEHVFYVGHSEVLAHNAMVCRPVYRGIYRIIMADGSKYVGRSMWDGQH